MIINNDQIEFTGEDFSTLSDFAKKALGELFKTSDVSGPMPGDFAKEFATILSNYVLRAKDNLKASAAKADPVIDSILAGLASADEAKLLEAEPLLTQLDDLLKA